MATVHIPTAGGLACGTRALTAYANTENDLCRRCQKSLERKIRAAIISRFHVITGSLAQAEATRRADLVLADVFGENKCQ